MRSTALDSFRNDNANYWPARYSSRSFASGIEQLAGSSPEATSIGEGIVAGEFAAAAAAMVVGRSRRELEDNALRNGFWGGLGGMSCLRFDLLLRYA